MNYETALIELKSQHLYRALRPVKKEGKFLYLNGEKYLNLSSNDYLGIAADEKIRVEFLKSANYSLGSTSSRLLTGNDEIYAEFEDFLAKIYNKDAALLFNSGYHANVGIMSGLLSKKDAVFCDKLNHASIIDGIRLSGAEFHRFKHLDYDHLELLLKKHRESAQNAIIITESLFSMDGDRADFEKLIELKEKYGAILVVDEAHAFGVYGEAGLGLSEKFKEKIDLIIGTFGKAAGSMGAFCAGDGVLIEYLVNKARPLIFSTALPEINVQFSYFVTKEIFPAFSGARAHLFAISDFLRTKIKEANLKTIGDSYIIPVILGENEAAEAFSKELLKNGFFLLPIRHPTVAQNTARVRISLRADLAFSDVENLAQIFSKI